MRYSFYSIVIIFCLFTTSSSNAQVLLKFTGTPSRTGTSGNVGTKYTWSNVGTMGSTNIKAVIEIISITGGASLESIDDASTGIVNAWQPIINGSQTNGNCWGMEFRVRFFVAGTNTRLTLSSFKAQGIDIDGDDNRLREYNRFDKLTGYLVESNTLLTITQSSGNYTFKGPTSTVDDIDITKTRYNVSALYSNRDSVNIVLGGCCDGGSCSTINNNRRHSIDFFSSVPYNNPVPVDMIFFHAEIKEKKTLLTWATASEINNSHFEIYRSRDGETWDKIGVVKGNGNSSSVSEYSFLDENPLVLNFYKLKQVDFDGKFQYSPKRMVGYEVGKIYIQGYPNPNNGKMTLEISRASTTDRVQVDVMDIQGNVILSETFEPSGSQNLLIPVDISAFCNGLYIVRVISGQSTQNFKLTKF